MTSWQISESGNTVTLDDKGAGTITVTVTNPGPDQDRAVLSITPLDGASREWFEIDEPQRAITGGDSAVYVVRLRVPEGTAEGSYGFQAVAYSADRDPQETSSIGRRIVFEVGPTDRPGFPWWLLAVVAALVAAVVIVVVVLTRGDPPSNLEEPTISGVTTALEELEASEGVWDGAEEFAFQWERCTVPEDPDEEPDAECEEIAVGIGKQYQLANVDAGSRVRVVVTASNGNGSASATSELSEVVAPVPPELIEVPQLVGLKQSVARALLENDFQALAVAIDGPVPDDCDPIVESQTPAPFTLLAKGEPVAFSAPRVTVQNQIACFGIGGVLVEELQIPLEVLDPRFRFELERSRP